MWRSSWLLFPVLHGCDGRTVDPPPKVETGTGIPTVPQCRLHPSNPLRAICGLQRDGTGPVEVVVRPRAGGEPVVFTGEQDATDVEIVLWDLLALQEYDYDLVDRGETVASGSFFTGSVPAGLRPQLDPVIDGPSVLGDDDRILFALACSGGPALMLVDGVGRLRWYEPTGPYGGISGFELTDRGTVVAAMGRRRILEIRFDGRPVTDLTVGRGLERHVHHAVVGPDDRVLALDTDAVQYPDGKSYLVDGVTEIVGGRATHVWNVGQIVDPVGLRGGDPFYWSSHFGDAVDFAHENSISIMDDGGWLLSFKHLNALVRLHPDDLAPRWVLTGEPSEAEIDGRALALVSSASLDTSFRHPHHASQSPWGTVLLVDNGTGVDTTRIMELQVDETNGLADVIADWDLGATCPVQSSAYGLADGTIFAACARSRELFELDRDAPGVIRRRVAVSCAEGGGNAFIRARPLTLPARR